MQVITLNPGLSNERIIRMIRRVRFPRGVHCLGCGSSEVIRWGRMWERPYEQRYHCKACRSWFNDLSGTVLEGSKMPPRDWMLIGYLDLKLHHSASAIARETGRNLKSVIRALELFRGASALLEALLPQLEGSVEMDEAYQKAGLKGRANSQRVKEAGRKPRKRGLRRRGRGTYQEDEPPVFCLVERGGRKRMVMGRNVQEGTVQDTLKRWVRPGSLVYHDDYPSYSGLEEAGYPHEAVCHSRGEYARGEAHINTCEGEFSFYRPFMAVHRGVAKYKLWLYLEAFNLHRRIYAAQPEIGLQQLIKI